jgi:hypothetical protein
MLLFGTTRAQSQQQPPAKQTPKTEQTADKDQRETNEHPLAVNAIA